MIPGLMATAVKSARRDRRILLVPELQGPFGVADVGLVETTDDHRGWTDDAPTPSVLPLLSEEDFAPPTRDFSPVTEEYLDDWSNALEQSTGASIASGTSEGFFLDFRSSPNDVARPAQEVREELRARLEGVARSEKNAPAPRDSAESAPQPPARAVDHEPVDLGDGTRRRTAPVLAVVVALMLVAAALAVANPAIADHLVSQFLDAVATLGLDVSSNN